MAELRAFPRATPSVSTSQDQLRVLVVAESFLPQINGVTNSVRRVLEHLAAEGHVAELVAPTGPDTYAGFRVRHARGANLPFYKDFKIGLETRRRLRQMMLRFQPDVVHIASPATLGYQAAKVADELGIPSVAIYQTDLVGFAERYDVPGGARAAASLTRRIHTRVDRTLAPSTASLAQLASLDVPATALWPRGVDLQQFHPARRDAALRARLLGGTPGDPSADRLLVGYVGRLAPEKELDLLTTLADPSRLASSHLRASPSRLASSHLRASPSRLASSHLRASPSRLASSHLRASPSRLASSHLRASPRVQLVVVGGGPEEQRLRALLPGASFLGVLHGDELAAVYASLDVFVHTGRHETYCQSAQEALASGVPVVAPRAGGPIDVVDDGVAGFLYRPGDGADLATYVDLLTRNRLLRKRMSLAARRSVSGRSWGSVNAALVDHYRDVIAGRQEWVRLAG